MKEVEFRNGRFVEKSRIVRVPGRFDYLFSEGPEAWWMVEVKLKAESERWKSKKEKMDSSLPSYYSYIS